MSKLKASSFNRDFYGCPKCDWPLDPHTGEWEDTGGVTCACGAFVSLPSNPYANVEYVDGMDAVRLAAEQGLTLDEADAIQWLQGAK